jgi:hypothetical protein
MRTMTTRLVLAIVAVGCLTAGVATSAIADGNGPKAKTKIAFKSLDASGSTGTLDSKKNFCLKNRKVSLFRLDDFVSDKVEIVYSDSKGNWKTKHQLQPGEYFSKVDAETINGTECLYAVSKNKTFN